MYMKKTISLNTNSCCILIVRRVWIYQRVILIRKSKKNRQHNGQTKKKQKDKQWSTKDTHKTKDRVTQRGNPTFPGSNQWLLYIWLYKMNLNLFYDFTNLVYFWIGISWLIEHSSFDLPSRWSKGKSHQESDLHHHGSQHKTSI